MISKLKLFFKWGISFDEPYILSDKGAREVSYISKEKLMKAVELKYLQKEKELIYYDDEDDEFDSKIRLKTGG
jgi:type IV secretion system protein VirD4